MRVRPTEGAKLDLSEDQANELLKTVDSAHSVLLRRSSVVRAQNRRCQHLSELVGQVEVFLLRICCGSPNPRSSSQSARVLFAIMPPTLVDDTDCLLPRVAKHMTTASKPGRAFRIAMAVTAISAVCSAILVLSIRFASEVTQWSLGVVAVAGYVPAVCMLSTLNKRGVQRQLQNFQTLYCLWNVLLVTATLGTVMRETWSPVGCVALAPVLLANCFLDAIPEGRSRRYVSRVLSLVNILGLSTVMVSVTLQWNPFDDVHLKLLRWSATFSTIAVTAMGNLLLFAVRNLGFGFYHPDSLVFERSDLISIKMEPALLAFLKLSHALFASRAKKQNRTFQSLVQRRLTLQAALATSGVSGMHSHPLVPCVRLSHGRFSALMQV